MMRRAINRTSRLKMSRLRMSRLRMRRLAITNQIKMTAKRLVQLSMKRRKRTRMKKLNLIQSRKLSSHLNTYKTVHMLVKRKKTCGRRIELTKAPLKG